MKTFVEFRSAKFPSYEGEEEQINPGLWGKRLAEYFASELAQRNIKTEEIIMEDWGCYLPIQNEGAELALCCGHQYGDDDQFLCFTQPQKPKIKKLFRTIDLTTELTQLLGTIKAILENDPDIRDMTWREP